MDQISRAGVTAFCGEGNRRGTVKLGGGLLLLLLATTGCATKGDLRNVRNALNGVAARQDSLLVELQRGRRVTADTLRTQTTAIQDFQGRVRQQLNEILRSMEMLTELTGQNSRVISQVRDQLVQLESAVRVGAPLVGATPLGAEQRAGDSAEELYAAAVQLMNDGLDDSALRGFSAFLQQYPNHDRAPYARFNRADLLERAGQYEQAVEEFTRIRELSPASDQVPAALYRIGMIYLNRLFEEEEGIRYLQMVVNSYGGTASAELARAELDSRAPRVP